MFTVEGSQVRLLIGIVYFLRLALDFERLTASESILEYLLKAQEFKNRQVHRRMESQPSLVGSQRRVELYTISAVDLDLALVIFPGDSELDDTLGDRSDFESSLVFGVLLEEGGVFERRSKFCG